MGDTQQIVGEAADCSDWTRMEGQGSWNVQQFRLKYRLVYLYVLRCYVKYKDLFWETGDRQLFHIQISAFQNRVWEIIHKSMVVYPISNITVHVQNQTPRTKSPPPPHASIMSPITAVSVEVNLARVQTDFSVFHIARVSNSV